MTEDQLMRCFSLAFPEATHDEIKAGRIEDIRGWDSLQGVTLLALLEERFQTQIDLPDLLELATFDALKDRLLNPKAEEPQEDYPRSRCTDFDLHQLNE